MKYTIWFKYRVNQDTYEKVHKTLDLVFGYALTSYVLCAGTKLEDYTLESDEDAECELDRILPDVGDIFGVSLSYESVDGDEEDEE